MVAVDPTLSIVSVRYGAAELRQVNGKLLHRWIIQFKTLIGYQ